MTIEITPSKLSNLPLSITSGGEPQVTIEDGQVRASCRTADASLIVVANEGLTLRLWLQTPALGDAWAGDLNHLLRDLQRLSQYDKLFATLDRSGLPTKDEPS